jgi:hypothetical protein
VTYRQIENPMHGATYHHDDEWGVYEYGTWPRGSVNEGRQSRKLLGRFDSEAEALAEYPDARPAGGSGYVEYSDRMAPPWFDPTAIGESWDGE